MKKDPSEKELLFEINENLKRLIAVVSTQGLDDETKIKMLTSMKYSSYDISEMTGIPARSIRRKTSKQK